MTTDSTQPEDKGPALPTNASIRTSFLLSVENSVFMAGSCMLIIAITTIAILWRINNPLWSHMLTMGFTQLLAGRAASIASATQANMHPALIVFFATYIDTTIVFILYPMFVFSYKHLFERRFFKTHIGPVFKSAQKHVGRLRRFKIASIFLFVWFPFWMTGIIIGSLLGFLMGLRTWVTMVTVVLGSASAVVCWVYAYDRLFSLMKDINEWIPLLLTVFIILALSIYRFVSLRRKNG